MEWEEEYPLLLLWLFAFRNITGGLIYPTTPDEHLKTGLLSGYSTTLLTQSGRIYVICGHKT
jgi:hypothetical protein